MRTSIRSSSDRCDHGLSVASTDGRSDASAKGSPITRVSCAATQACTTGAIYTRITVPLDLDSDATVYHRHDEAESADSLNLNVLRVVWGGNGLAQTAREHGFESIAYADLEILQVLGVWRQEFAIIYGRLAAEP